MNYKYIVYTPVIELGIFLKEVESVIDILKNNKVKTVTMFYGWSWGEWQPFETSVDNIFTEIKAKEEKTGDLLGENDVIIEVNEIEISITFCHETDIHIEFNQLNEITSDILNDWAKKGLVHCVRKENVNITLAELVK